MDMWFEVLKLTMYYEIWVDRCNALHRRGNSLPALHLANTVWKRSTFTVEAFSNILLDKKEWWNNRDKLHLVSQDTLEEKLELIDIALESCRTFGNARAKPATDALFLRKWYLHTEYPGLYD